MYIYIVYLVSSRFTSLTKELESWAAKFNTVWHDKLPWEEPLALIYLSTKQASKFGTVMETWELYDSQGLITLTSDYDTQWTKRNFTLTVYAISGWKWDEITASCRVLLGKLSPPVDIYAHTVLLFDGCCQWVFTFVKLYNSPWIVHDE